MLNRCQYLGVAIGCLVQRVDGPWGRWEYVALDKDKDDYLPVAISAFLRAVGLTEGGDVICGVWVSNKVLPKSLDDGGLLMALYEFDKDCKTYGLKPIERAEKYRYPAEWSVSGEVK